MFGDLDAGLGPTETVCSLNSGGLVVVGEGLPNPGDQGISLPRELHSTISTNRGFSVELDVRCTERAVRIVGFVVKPEKGEPFSPYMLRQSSYYLYSMAMHSLLTWLSLTPEDEVPTAERVREVIQRAMLPQQEEGESRAQYVHRLWKSEYEPSGRTQNDLARDLGRGLDLIRKYVSQESRQNLPTPNAERGTRRKS